MRPETWFDHLMYLVFGVACAIAVVLVIALIALFHLGPALGMFILGLIVLACCYGFGRSVLGPPSDEDNHGV